ncbi:guanylate kinase [Gloeocapsa sp. PCC 73106]|uniref:guanylate kinase n=1 Tax=Gloeocapsa sp. PCC 73106 TaxID=102232 RepID=UPI0002AC6F65|nr:guanylate kinase [Gloeocapsa sp. PCC 73106]ELR97795.1 guanylate kinase [Gloeocapsa sp. PCC 73106]
MTKGKLILITGPSGVGKGTIVRELLNRHSQLYLSISATTRSPRPGEVNGKDYYFVNPCQFEAMIASQTLLEWAEYTGNYYGTPRQQVETKIEQGRWVILEIEVQGARKIKKNFSNTLSLFILPPSFAELEHRLRNRGNNSDTDIHKRLEQAKLELQAAVEFDYQIINDDLDAALQRIETVIFSECSQ